MLTSDFINRREYSRVIHKGSVLQDKKTEIRYSG